MTDIEATIARVLELDEEATDGPWEADIDTWVDPRIGNPHLDLGPQNTDATGIDFKLIDAYRTAAPELARALNEIIEADETDGLTQGLLSAIDERNAIEKQSNARIAGLNSDAESFRQRIIDAACLRDDVSDDDMVDAVRRLASPSGEVSDGA